MADAKRRGEACEFCPGRVTWRILSAPFRFRGRDVHLQGVWAGVCGRCGEPYFESDEVKRLEQYLGLARVRDRKPVTDLMGRFVWQGNAVLEQRRLRHA
jgi:YgiT-type zinc finger domain-containing protein